MRVASPSAAQEIALRALAKAATLSLAALDGDAWPTGSEVPAIYGVPEGFPRAHWVVFVHGPQLHVGASTVVVVRKADGAVVFQGDVGE